MNPMDLSIIILSFNTKELTKNCLDSVVKSLQNSVLKTEIIVIDNASKDGSVEMLKEFSKNNHSKNIKLEFIFNNENVGYPKGNNQGIKVAKGKYVLLLNSDVVINDVDFEDVLQYINTHPEIGVLTVKLNLPQGGIDPASHRGFPTAWNAFCYFSKLERYLGRFKPLSKIFGGYHLLERSLDTVHEIDSPTGAFFLTRLSLLKDIQGFDEGFFMYGEDLDLAYRIKKKGYKVIYYPHYTATHFKHHSGLKGKDEGIRKKTRVHFFEAMKIFYTKHYDTKYPFIIKKLIFLFIDFKKSSL